MIKVDFGNDEFRRDIPIEFNNFQGMNMVDDNTNLPKQHVPYAYNVDFSRVVGAAAKRRGCNSLFPSLGAGGIKGCHVYRKSSGDIPLFGHGTDLYKLTGTEDTITKTTDEDFEAGTLTDIVAEDDSLRLKYAAHFLPVLIYSQTGIFYTSYGLGLAHTSVGQEFLLYKGIRKIYKIVGSFKYWGAGTSVTLTLYDSPSKANTLGSVTVDGPQSAGDEYQECAFVFDNPIDVTPETTIYYEYTASGGSVVVGGMNTADAIPGYRVYTDGSPDNKGTLYLKMYEARNCYMMNGTYESESIDLGSTPTTSSITMNSTVSTYAPTPESGPVVAASGSGSFIGIYKYKVAFVDSRLYGYWGNPSEEVSVTALANGQLDLTDIPTYTGFNRVIFRTKANDDKFYYLTTIADDTTTTYTDTTADSSLTVEMVAPNTPNTSLEYYVKGSIDGQNWGDWINVVSGEACPLTRYIKFKAVFQGTPTASPILQDYTITFTGAYNSAVSIKSGLSGNRIRFVDWADKCYFVDGGTPWVYDGTDVTAITSSNPPPASTIIFEKNNYFFYVATNDPSKLYVSSVGVPSTVQPSSYFQLPGPILGVASYLNHLIVTGKNYTVAYSGTIFNPNVTVGDWKQQVIDDIGCESHEAIKTCIDGKTGTAVLIMPTKKGIQYLYPGLQEYSLQAAPISRNVQPYFDQAIDLTNMSAIFYNQAYYIAFNWLDPTGQEVGYNNTVMKLDLRNREWSGRWNINSNGFLESNGILYIADSQTGDIHEHKGTSDNGEKINMVLDPSFVGNHEKRRFKKVIIDVKRGSDTTDSKIITRVDDSEGTLNIGPCTNWAGASLSSRDAQDAIKSPQKNIPSSRGYNFGFRFQDNSTNDVVLYGVTILAEPSR